MTVRHAFQTLISTCGLVMLVACKAQPNPSAPAPYVRPENWTTECVGRYVFDAPAPMAVGAVPVDFRPGGRMQYQLPKETDGYGGGDVSVALLDVFETRPLAKADDFGDIDDGATGSYRAGYINSAGTPKDYEHRKATTFRYPLKWPTSFVWRSDHDIDFGIYIPEDRRARMIHGYPADPRVFPKGISGEKAKAMIESFWSRYQPRQPQVIPSKPGICTPYGFIEDPKGLTEQNYGVHVSFLHPTVPNLLLKFSVASVTNLDGEAAAELLPIERQETPWEWENRTAKKEREDCKQRVAGPGSRDLFGCAFAGMRGIKSHREVEYVTLGDGRKARVLMFEWYSSEGVQYEVTIETAAKLNSATEPVVSLWAGGMSGKADAPAFKGRQPPPIDEVVKLLKTMAASVRLRDGAIEPGAQVGDSLADFR